MAASYSNAPVGSQMIDKAMAEHPEYFPEELECKRTMALVPATDTQPINLQSADSATIKQLERFESHKNSPREELLQAYISTANLLVIDYKSRSSGFYYRMFYGTRGGWQGTQCYKNWDTEDKKPYHLHYEEKP